MGRTKSQQFVSRGGDKLSAALDYFGLSMKDRICADLGSHTGGFVDCLLQRGASRVYSIDTCYGVLAWRLRKDPRVIVMERTNALHVELPEQPSLVSIDVGWTRQSKILAAASALMDSGGFAISLIKPQYEADKDILVDGVVPDGMVDHVVKQTLSGLDADTWRMTGLVSSPIRGHGGNREVFALLERV